MLLFSAVHWGTLSVCLIVYSPYEQLYYPSIIVMSAFAMGGTATLSIATLSINFYSVIIYAPTIFARFHHDGGDLEVVMLSIMALLSTLYILIVSAASSRNYYYAITNREIAEKSAKELRVHNINDALTQLNNRMYFNNCFIDDWKRCDRFNCPRHNIRSIMTDY